MYSCPVTKKTLDPLHCIRKLHLNSGHKINEWIENYHNGVERFENEELIVNCARQVFELPRYDSDTYTGFPDEQVLQCLAEFNRYIEGKE